MKALFFSTPCCSQCKVIKPRFVEECEKLNLQYELIDAESDEASVSKYSIKSVPFVVVLDCDNNVVTSGHAATITTILNTL